MKISTTTCVSTSLLLLAATAAAQPTLLASPVPGRLGWQQATYWTNATIIPPLSLVYLTGAVGNNASDMAVQAAVALDTLQSQIQTLGSTMDAAVRCNVFLTDIADFPGLNSVYPRYFKGFPPPRTTVEINALSVDSRIEIDMVFYDPVFSSLKASS